MAVVTFKGKKYNCPEHAKEVTVGQMIALGRAETIADSVSILTGIKKTELLEVPKNVAEEIAYFVHGAGNLADRLKKSSEEINQDSYKPVKKFKVGKDTYHVPENMDRIKYGQYIDICEELKNKESVVEFIPYLLAISCLKYRERYNPEKVDYRAKQMEEANYVDGLNILYFFLTTDQSFLNAFLQHFHQKTNQTLQQQDGQSINESMAYISASIASLKKNLISKDYTVKPKA